MKEKIVASVPIIGQQKAPQGPTALFRVRRGETETLFCGHNPLDALSVFYGSFLGDPTIVCEATPLQTAFQGRPVWEQVLPTVEEPT